MTSQTFPGRHAGDTLSGKEYLGVRQFACSIENLKALTSLGIPENRDMVSNVGDKKLISAIMLTNLQRRGSRGSPQAAYL
jgi:hypothetical protein